MESKFQTSFIPKQSLERHEGGGRRAIGFLLLITVIIFLASIAAAGGVFLYGTYLNNKISQSEGSLNTSKQEFEPTTVAQYTRLSDRLADATVILNQHIALSRLFDVLSQATLQTVQFTDFTYSFGSDGKVSISMKGTAQNYESVALQSDAFSAIPTIFKSPIFSNLNSDQNGNAVFTFSSDIDPNFLLYKSQ